MSKPPEIVADEIISKYKGLVWGNTMFTRSQRMKQCAIIYCEGIIDVIKKDEHWNPIDYYNQVLTILKTK